jgi:hypothetical protein
VARASDAVGGLITFASLLWDANDKSHSFSRAYTDEWAVKLFNGFRRNCTAPYQCVLYTDRHRDLPGNIIQEIVPGLGLNGYGDCIYPYRANAPMILVGLDTLVIGNIDKFARWCLEHPGKLALPKHPWEDYSINGVALWGGHNPDIFGNWRGENDMDWIRQFPHERIDELWPGRVVSYRAHVRPNGVGKARLIYFHGRSKFNELLDDELIRTHWR